MRWVGSDAGGQAHEGIALADKGGAQALGGPDAARLGGVFDDDAEAGDAEATDSVGLAQGVAQDVGEGDQDVLASLVGDALGVDGEKEQGDRLKLAAGGGDAVLEASSK